MDWNKIQKDITILNKEVNNFNDLDELANLQKNILTEMKKIEDKALLYLYGKTFWKEKDWWDKDEDDNIPIKAIKEYYEYLQNKIK